VCNWLLDCVQVRLQVAHYIECCSKVLRWLWQSLVQIQMDLHLHLNSSALIWFYVPLHLHWSAHSFLCTSIWKSFNICLLRVPSFACIYICIWKICTSCSCISLAIVLVRIYCYYT